MMIRSRILYKCISTVNAFRLFRCPRYNVVHTLPLQDGGTALMGASQNGHLDVVRVLVEAGADMTLKDEVWGRGRQDKLYKFLHMQ